MRRCSARGEKQSCRDSEGNARPVEGGPWRGVECSELRPSVSLILSLFPPPPRGCPREVHLEQPGQQRDAGGQGVGDWR